MDSVKEWATQRGVGQSPRRGHTGKISAYAAKPGTGPEGKRCKHCARLVRVRCSKTYFKCGAIWNGKSSAASDIRANSPACHLYEPEQA